MQVSIEATKLYYEIANTDLCDCAYCQNYIAAFPAYFPKRFVEILQNMEIDPLKPFHISEVCKNRDNHHMYIGDYDFVGAVIKKAGENPNNKNSFTIDILGITPKHTVQFSIMLPWVIEEEVESINCSDLES